ncbi:PfaD family polyunsaturated fatty acid/polyketide biosynthesis protein [Nocardia arthritidis]|uniref:PfaD family polyunsaturated fatty acid/polyketide biosynthesis protein n=1 Tax=Nocardia arthritidis TaxID=228602 RepID=A0A6G9YLF2_9NOCA|nr:PfaD family polyunsaturated fatty acid/polyketide biosynthesis protein [Nocardia arthritidis]QIS14034.1 PfaD family polyunsaturated fatty acid/polyketide biosynthesis protein [Nocardia arthritidis]
MTADAPPHPRPPAPDLAEAYDALALLDAPCYAVARSDSILLTNDEPTDSATVLAAVPPLPPERLGASGFRTAYGVRYAYMSGAMAGGIASADLVIALARAGLLASFGAAGLTTDRVDTALRRFRAEIPDLPYCANLIHSPSESAMERAAVELFLRYGVTCVEASAFMSLTPTIVRYRVAGLSRDGDGRVRIGNRVIAKVSRAEVAEPFLRPAPPSMVADLLARQLISPEQAELARSVPMADDLTVEADSGGHTDRRPLAVALPELIALRDCIQRELRYRQPVRVGAAGGIGTPRAAAAAFACGAEYVVTGSINQSCVEAGTSEATRGLLVAAKVSDCEMAPSADMFEMGVTVQVLKRGTLFPMRAKLLYQLYQNYDGVDALPPAERDRVERQILRRPIEAVWSEVVDYFQARDPAQLDNAAASEKRKMALIFRWYLGQSSRWASIGDPGRVHDYQVWCGPAMGAFNEWAQGTYLATDRRVADVAVQLMRGAAFSSRVHQLRLLGVGLPAGLTEYRPLAPVGTEVG